MLKNVNWVKGNTRKRNKFISYICVIIAHIIWQYMLYYYRQHIYEIWNLKCLYHGSTQYLNSTLFNMFQSYYVRVISFKKQISMSPLPSIRANHGLHKRMHTLQSSNNQWPSQLSRRCKANNPPRKLVSLKFLRLESWNRMGNTTHLDHLKCPLDLEKIMGLKLSPT